MVASVSSPMTGYQLLSSIIFIVITSSNQVHSFCVSEDDGNNSAACIENNRTQACCKSLPFLMENLADLHNIEIHVLQDIILDSMVSLKDSENTTIQSDENVKIKCNKSSKDTGFYFKNVTNLSLVNLTIEGCGMLQNSSTLKTGSTDEYELTWCAVYVIKSTNLTLTNVIISYSKGTGLVVYDTSGMVSIGGSFFKDNAVTKADVMHPGGGGVKIEITYCNPNDTGHQITTYTIEDCRFIGNHALETADPKNSGYDYYFNKIYQGHGRGGGLSIIMRGHTSNNNANVTNCEFVNNTASTWGGGVYLSIRDYPAGNTVTFSGCTFENNTCKYFGGGGLHITLLNYEGIAVSNKLSFRKCNFSSNHAKLNGGGMALVATREDKLENAVAQLNNTILFQDCTWHKNKAAWGSAVDISPALWDVLGNGILPTPSFCRCTFTENHVTEDVTWISPGIAKSTRGVGTMLVSNFVIDVVESLDFINNNGTALYLQSALFHLKSGTSVVFIGNKAHEGGAVAMYSFSVIYMSSNSSINFTNNTAEIRGGAVYTLSNDQHERYSSRSCFIQTVDRESQNTSKNVTITFRGNMAITGSGNSIYATSLKPCTSVFTFSTCEDSNVMENHKESMSITIIGLRERDLATSYCTFEYTSAGGNGSGSDPNLRKLIPGQYFTIPITAYDELGNTISLTYDMALESSNSSYVDVPSYVSDTTIRLKSQGRVDQNQLLLTSGHTTLSINITITDCPPGHTIGRYNVCTCDTSYFKGIWKCERGRKVASIINGYWIGLCGNTQCTGHCPVGFCNNDISTELRNVTIYNTHKVLCINNREGKLCGRCSANHSVYYHSHYFRCGEESHCNIGILLYIVSELLPLTVIFVIVIMVNVSFTNGAVNGVILYAQIFDSFITNFHNIIHFPKFVNLLVNGYRVVYTMSNLNYFSIEKMSFCLWKGATTLDVIAWKYVTIVYALCLVIVSVFLLNTTRCKKICVCWRPHTVKNAAIHGLIAFLVMCYSQCAKVSFLLLTRVSLDGNKFNTSENVVYMSGSNMLFDDEHIKYGIPALFFMLVVVILPPMLLFLYPLSFKVLSLCRLSELKIVNRISNIIPIQLFDSFQSCYKDDLRFFSGLYFFYRVIPLILFAVNTDLILYYFSVEVFLIIALALNATLQPYKNRWHNITDSLIFTNLAIINAISLYNYQKINEGKDHMDRVKTSLAITTSLQLVLIYLPLLYIFIHCSWMLIKWVMKRAHERKISKLDYSQKTLLDSTYLPPLREEHNLMDSTVEFHEMR